MNCAEGVSYGLRLKIHRLEEVLCGDVAYHVVIATDDDVLVVAGLLLEHLALGNLQAARDLLYHLVVFSA